ncbi:uncharacterized protein BO97DRAFT_413069 [Aspergillus homomorphus CBS 101889]|uniref:Prokineticin domain-containing protein n=1 Tax=Aspergillus homomorphus (strain CBS 101889) TaxID=1450537 RepID=A0A395I0X6_ASPHC|nr:hypothetical protein BO97DRAFT_413069 [Aspergillus homomorphus CBS 101889]RAL13852.1 hypothetical protein BO97DRAFT_413069 [Aspergillus homomorphus CBS 101889]
MKFLILVTVLLAPLVSAADICRTSRDNCEGTRVCCNGIHEGQCCNLGATVRHIRYTLPADSRGRSWTGNSCQGEVRTFPNRHAGTSCHRPANPGGRSGKWLRGLGSADEEEGDVVVEAHHSCAEPNTLYYEGEDGLEESAALPGHLSADEVLEALERGVSVKTLIIQEIRE